MILLADTNVFIKYWRTLATAQRDEAAVAELEIYKRIMTSNEVVTCGVVRAELLHGATSEKNYQRMIGALSKVPSKDLAGSDWDELGRQLFRYRLSGFTVPFTDAAIASIALKYDIPVWANDKHFEMMKNVISQLKVYRTEELI